jgi:dihydrofolate reductase
MRKLVLQMQMSLDGFVGTPSGEMDWIFPGIDDEVGELFVEELWRAGVHAMGRSTYHDMAAHWPNDTSRFAAPMNERPKVVFSRTLDDARWGPVRVASGDIADEVAKLKREEGGEILAHGGAGFARALTSARLVDEYRFTVHPLALGDGLRAFAEPMDLRLQSTRTFASGAVRHVYMPA